MKTSTTQQEAVINYVNRHGYVDAHIAAYELGITRMSAIAYALKDTHHALKQGNNGKRVDGYVRYVPDFESRIAVLKAAQVAELHGVYNWRKRLEINTKYEQMVKNVVLQREVAVYK
ncbi:hypothetical protein [Vibrio sp. SCSIO 43137]|uniref:hypothetical protein n=1 Tax=Vibrio sp. SCSIO 43137 TaxID=3021011 RepID=UPI002306E2F4|nr:hypothetical protein [Vibrio sp. SCSIO 43137]WCE28440.1 hypothetical protein PK654_08630 [Vibrio sp. SCSIO 43137]